jgi:hypothetical protein
VLAHLTQRKQRGLALSDELKKAEASGSKLINIDVTDAPREMVVAQSPEHLLRECKKKLRSERIFFNGSSDRKDVVQLLFDLEDMIAVEVDRKRAAHLKLRTEDLESAHATELGEARRSRSRKLLQRLTFHEEPMPTLHVPTNKGSHRAMAIGHRMFCENQRARVIEQLTLASGGKKLEPTDIKDELAAQWRELPDNGKQWWESQGAKHEHGSGKIETCRDEDLRAANMFDGLINMVDGLLGTCRAALFTSQADDRDLNAQRGVSGQGVTCVSSTAEII